MIIFLCLISILWLVLVSNPSVILHAPFLHLASILCAIAIIAKFALVPVRIRIKLAGFAYIIWLLREVFNSAVDVTKYVYGSEKYKFQPSAAWIKTKQKDEFGTVIYANSITLTPGTITIDMKNNELLIHALDNSGMKDLKKGDMDNRILMYTSNV